VSVDTDYRVVDTVGMRWFERPHGAFRARLVAFGAAVFRGTYNGLGRLENLLPKERPELIVWRDAAHCRRGQITQPCFSNQSGLHPHPDFYGLCFWGLGQSAQAEQDTLILCNSHPNLRQTQ